MRRSFHSIFVFPGPAGLSRLLGIPRLAGLSGFAAFAILAAIPALTFFTACSGGHKTLIEGSVVAVSKYGGLVPSFSAAQFDSTGVEYGDMLDVKLGDEIALTMPYVDAYTEAGCMSPCLCNYNKSGSSFSISFSCGSFVQYVGGGIGDRVRISMHKKGGYLKEYLLMQGTYTFDREDYESGEAFANFREVTTTGIRPGKLYRSSNPINCKRNKIRHFHADSLCRLAGIRTVIDIADTDEEVRSFIGNDVHEDTYMYELLEAGGIVGLGCNADFLSPEFLQGVSRACRAILERPGPYLVNCNEGKDRTGFYGILFEALCGAEVQEMKEDYMKSFENLYHQTAGNEAYELTWELNGFRMLYLIANPQTWNDVADIDWGKASIDGVDLQKAAAEYIAVTGLTEKEIESLKNRLTNI